MLWASTRKTAQLIERQLSIQNASLQSASQHQILSAHRDIFLRLTENEELTRLLHVGAQSEQEISAIRRTMLASILVNHCLRIYLDTQAGQVPSLPQYDFASDAADMFSLPIVQQKWPIIRSFQPKDFVEFIEKQVLPKCERIVRSQTTQ